MIKPNKVILKKIQVQDLFLILILTLSWLPWDKFDFVPLKVSVNYSYSIVVILIGSLYGSRLKLPPKILLIFLITSLVSGILATITTDLNFTLERFFSFIVFYLPFLGGFFLPSNKFKTLLLASLILGTIIMASHTFIEILLLDLKNDINFKREIGSQRYHFVTSFVFFYLFHKIITKQQTVKFNIMLIILCFLFAVCVYLSYSKAIVLSSILVGIYAIIFYALTGKLRFLTFFTIIFLSGSVIYYFSSDTILYQQQFFISSLQNIFSDFVVNYDKDGTSIGDRIRFFKNIYEFALVNPFGSGWLGYSHVFDDPNGSEHNQYFVLLLRLGFLCFFIYILLIVDCILKMRKYERGIYFGLLVIILFGFAHESFKLAQGGFIFYYILSLVNFYDKQKRVLQ